MNESARGAVKSYEKIKWRLASQRQEKKVKYGLKMFHPHTAVDKEHGNVMVRCLALANYGIDEANILVFINSFSCQASLMTDA